MNDTSQPRFLVNKLYDEINIGDSASLKRTLMPEDVKLFAVLTGDVNPAVVDPKFSESGMFREVIAHGMWSGSLISTVLGTQFPGPGTILIDQSLHFARPVTIGDTITITVTVKQKFDYNRHVIFDCVCTNQEGLQVVRGMAEVLAPTEKVSRLEEVHMPEIRIDDKHERYTHLLSRVKGLEPIPTAVAHPCDKESLKGPVIAFQEGIIEPILVGPENKIRSVAEEFGIDLHGIRIVNAAHSHDSAALAVSLVRTGDAEALMKGSLHTDELMGEVVARANGLRTNRRISHVFLMDVPTYHRPLLITDAAINIAPSLEDKVDIIQNAIELAHVIGIPEPKVAILSAVETVNPKIQSTLDAAALCKMADRGQIKGGILDGPLAFDNAVSIVAAKTKGIKSAVAGHAEILVVPDLESGNMVAKQLEYLANALTAGIVLGTKVPIVLTSRADSAETRTASCVIAALIAHNNRKLGTV
ncbi:bifunctional enoyl-CoA hydratase/phosphate acetyltransferase [Dechloromonas sp.]|uniref:bifunctional enoyl-CoA hydratase/phosphate acetyltransferase n=1 Tax=Dechloromonas sp. TaxID=1917218 RepID=UPI00121ACACF|nr:bifunctional enoyl-CoA hydratase/phosphate acetyltransferase [Dechloromonas sp.]MBU3697504.1 bifunctional enoyl-CoA hydratase/phosphate acetyltransferase [Dechloromonas sp.]TEX49746.1 MAG: enoyl-CoA hydratase [Rhodocyclaceae bacterium]